MGDNVNLKTDKEKRENFLTYCNLRLDNTIRSIKTIGNLKNQRAYKYDEEDIKNIQNFITEELDKVIKQLKSSLNGEVIQAPKREIPKRIT